MMMIVIIMTICRIILAEDRLKKHKTQQPHLAEIEQSYAHRNLRSVYFSIFSKNTNCNNNQKNYSFKLISCFILGLLKQFPIEEMIFHKISISLFCDPQ